MSKRMVDDSQIPSAEASSLFPQTHLMPSDLIEEWQKVPSDFLVSVQIRKKELDNLFFSISALSRSISDTNNSFIAWSNGDLAKSQELMNNSFRNAIDSQNNIRIFFQAVIDAAMKGKESA